MIKRKILCLLILIPIFGVAQTNTLPYIPIEKNIDKLKLDSLFLKGKTKVYKNNELKYIAMPCGGIGAGQVEVTGGGKLCFRKMTFNAWQPSNGGGNNGFSTGYHYLHPKEVSSEIENDSYLIIHNKENEVYRLNSTDFDDLEFIGEYPLAKINYKMKQKKLPLEISSEIFSPFVPMNVRYSANPTTIIRYKVKNTSDKDINFSLASWMKNKPFPVNNRVSYATDNIKFKDAQGILLSYNRLGNDDDILTHPGYGNLSLAVINNKAKSYFNCDKKNFIQRVITYQSSKDNFSSSSISLGDGLSVSIHLKPNEEKTVSFIVGWYYPNLVENAYNIGYVGRIYDNWYNSSSDVIKYISENYSSLYQLTKKFNETYFDSTLPYWMSNRILMSVSTLSCANISLWKNGRMYSYEGVGFCNGTCGHVYNFVTAISHLFPSLERSVRTMQDFNYEIAQSKSGRINFRGHNPSKSDAQHAFASDAQSGYVLKAYREHLMSEDNSFLKSIWPHVKEAIGYCIFKDGAEIGLEPNGVLECKQTFWDPMWFGPNPYNNTLYLAALRAAEQMAKCMQEDELAQRYHSIFLKGERFMNLKMWNGEYYTHLYPMGFTGREDDNGFRSAKEIEEEATGYVKAFNNNDDYYYTSEECDANQLFGQNWAYQLNLGSILPKERCQKAAHSIFKYNWTPDISTVYDYKKPINRTLAQKGEGGLVNGAWPNNRTKSFENTHDKSDTWTGLEYEAACDMINEGLLNEAFIIIKAVDERYNALKRNPWNQIEGADHYTRAMHSWNILLSLSGFFSDGPGHFISFLPNIYKDNFKSFFSTANSWGNVEHVENEHNCIDRITVEYGDIELKKIQILKINGYDKFQVFLNKNRIPITLISNDNDKTNILSFNKLIKIDSNSNLEIVSSK